MIMMMMMMNNSNSQNASISYHCIDFSEIGIMLQNPGSSHTSFKTKSICTTMYQILPYTRFYSHVVVYEQSWGEEVWCTLYFKKNCYVKLYKMLHFSQLIDTVQL